MQPEGKSLANETENQVAAPNFLLNVFIGRFPNKDCDYQQQQQ